MKRTTILMAAFLCLFSLTESPAQNTHKNMELLNPVSYTHLVHSRHHHYPQ